MTVAPGSVFQISVADGYGYAQLRACHRVYGDIVGLDGRIFARPVADLTALCLSHILIFPLRAAIAAGAVAAMPAGTARVDGPPIPDFKFAVRDAAGAPIYWWIWTGEEIVLAEPMRDLATLPERVVASCDQFLEIWDRAAVRDH
ncbi:MAG: hypothetical protein AAGE13_01755 [Pseudomonadota bacterium]